MGVRDVRGTRGGGRQRRPAQVGCTGEGLAVRPPLAGAAGEWLREDGPRPLRLGRPGLASPWRLCRDGCCLRLLGTPPPHGAAQWLRILVAEITAVGSVVSGQSLVAGYGTTASAVLVVDADGVHEEWIDLRA